MKKLLIAFIVLFSALMIISGCGEFAGQPVKIVQNRKCTDYENKFCDGKTLITSTRDIACKIRVDKEQCSEVCNAGECITMEEYNRRIADPAGSGSGSGNTPLPAPPGETGGTPLPPPPGATATPCPSSSGYTKIQCVGNDYVSHTKSTCTYKGGIATDSCSPSCQTGTTGCCVTCYEVQPLHISDTASSLPNAHVGKRYDVIIDKTGCDSTCVWEVTEVLQSSGPGYYTQRFDPNPAYPTRAMLPLGLTFRSQGASAHLYRPPRAGVIPSSLLNAGRPYHFKIKVKVTKAGSIVLDKYFLLDLASN